MIFKPEDFDDSGDGPLRRPAHEIANAKIAPVLEENERLKTIEKLMERDPEWGNEFAAVTHFKAECDKLTEQNRELESIVSKRVPKLEKILSIMKDALEEIDNKAEMTILGPSQYDDCRDERQAHEIGAHKAFGQQAEVAREALAKCEELEDK